MRELTICVSVLLLIIGLISCRSDIPAETTPYRKPPSPEIIPASTVPPNVSGDDIREPDSQTMKAIRQLAQEHPGLSFGVRGIYAQQGPQADTFRVEEKTPFIGEFRLWNAQLEAHEFAVTCLVDHVQTPCTPEESLTQLITLEADEEVRLPLKVCNLARGLHDLSVMFWQDPYADSHNPEAESRIFDSDTYRARVSIFAGGDTTPPNHDRERLSGRPAHRITDFTISQEIDPRGEHGSFPIVTHLSTSAGKKLDLFVHLNNVESIGIDYAITAFIDYKQVPLYRDGAERIPLHVHVPPSTWQPVAVQIQAPIESGQYEFFVVSTVFPFARLDVETEEYYGIDALINRPYFSARILQEVEWPRTMSIPSFSLLPASATRTTLCPARLIASQAKADEGGTLSFVTKNEDTPTLVAAIRRATQAAGFISKDEAAPALVDAIRRAARGEVLYTEKQLVRVDRWRRDVGRRWESLTEREHEVLRLLIEGRSSAAVAEVLSLTVRTVT